MWDDREKTLSPAATAKRSPKVRAPSVKDGGEGPDEFETRQLKLRGHRVAYRQAGSGAVVVLIHGDRLELGDVVQTVPPPLHPTEEGR